MLKMLGAIVQNLIARANRPPNLCIPGGGGFGLLEHYNKIYTSIYLGKDECLLKSFI
jgi:hypothetical protein